MCTEGGKILFLIGFMGAGKSAVLSLLSEKLACLSVDLDELIVEGEGRTIPDIFATGGEDLFRTIEARTLNHALLQGYRLISTGGGIVTRPENMDLMRQQGIMVYLRAEFDTLVHRIGEGSGRPLASGSLDELRALFLSRETLYESAPLVVDTDEKSVAEVVSEILANISLG